MSIKQLPPTGPFQHRFDQLGVFENGRTPVFLTEDQYNRAKACWMACAGFDTAALDLMQSLGETMLTRFKARDAVEQTVIAERLQAIQQRDAMAEALRQIDAGSNHTGRYLNGAGEEVDEGADGAEWVEFTDDEQLAWLDSVAAIAKEAMANVLMVTESPPCAAHAAPIGPRAAEGQPA